MQITGSTHFVHLKYKVGVSHFKFVSMLFFMTLNLLVFAQKRDFNWMLGDNGPIFNPQGGYGLIDIKFDETGIVMGDWVNDSTNHFRWLFNFTGIVMSSEAGEKLFYYNGFQIRDFENNIPVGGDSLNDTFVRQLFWGGHAINNGLPVRQSSIALPIPETVDEYIILTTTVSESYLSIGKVISDKIYTHRLKQTEDGLEVLYSNQTILDGDRLTPGGLSAVRHANGRDWWLMFGRVAENLEYMLGYHQYLLTPNGLEYQQFHAFDFPVYSYGSGQFCYNQDGSRLILTASPSYIEPFRLVIMDFDRCTGALSNVQQAQGPQLGLGNGCAISPNNRYLYVSNVFQVYQYDLEADNIFDTEIQVGQVDTYQLNPNFVTISGNAILAPDGKIYFANGSSSMGLNVIHHPDSAGLASGFEQDGLALPVRNFRTIPNFPNYCLGALEGSPCDTLGLPYNYCKTDSIVSVQDVLESEMGNLTIYPNPTHSMATVQIPGPGRLALYDLQGRLLRQESIAAHQMDSPTAHELQINTNTLPGGMYMLVFYSDYGYVYRGKLGVVK